MHWNCYLYIAYMGHRTFSTNSRGNACYAGKKMAERSWDYTVMEAWSRCLPCFLFRSVSSQIEAIFDRSGMFCRNCGKGLESSFAFCPNCGAKVEAETSLSSRDNIVGSASLTSQTSRKRASPSFWIKPLKMKTKGIPFEVDWRYSVLPHQWDSL